MIARFRNAMRSSRPASRAFTMIEASISTVIVGLMLVAALNAMGVANLMQFRIVEQANARLLAQSLMAEILPLDYADPVYGPDSFGRNATENATGDRSLFDDVDDYAGWKEYPPVEKNGTAIPWASGLRRVTTVDWVDPNDLDKPVSTNNGVKRIIVEVDRGGRVLSRLVAYRTQVWKDAITIQGGG